MTRIVLDASVFLASLIAEGPTRGILLGHGDLEFYAPEVVVVEIKKHLPMVIKRTGKPRDVVETLLKDILTNVQVIPTEIFVLALPAARERAKRAHADNDEAYVALADVLSAPIWTYDKDFRRIQGVSAVSTSEVEHLAEGALPPP